MNKGLLTTIIVGGLITSSCTKEDIRAPTTKENTPPPKVVTAPTTGQKITEKTDSSNIKYQDNYDKLLGILDPTGRMLGKNLSQAPNTIIKKDSLQNNRAQPKIDQSNENFIKKIIAALLNL